jgi:hypothetical protein
VPAAVVKKDADPIPIAVWIACRFDANRLHLLVGHYESQAGHHLRRVRVCGIKGIQPQLDRPRLKLEHGQPRAGDPIAPVSPSAVGMLRPGQIGQPLQDRCLDLILQRRGIRRNRIAECQQRERYDHD